MPEIPTYQRETGAPNTVRGVVPHADGYSPIAQGLSDIGRGLSQVGADLAHQEALRKQAEEKQSDELARAWSGEQTGQSLLDNMSDLEEAKRTAAPGAPGFASAFLERVDKRKQQVLAAAPDPKSKRFAELQLQAQRSHFGEQAQAFQFKARDIDVVDRHEKAIDSMAIAVGQDPKLFGYATTTLQAARPDVVPDVRLRLEERERTTLSRAAAASQVQTNPGATYDLLYRSLHPTLTPPAATSADGAPASADGGIAGSSPERGLRNNNPGNLRKGAQQWQGETVGTDPAFSTFETPEAGIRALGKNLLTYQDAHSINTVQGIVSRWAPASENPTAAYIANVSKALGVAPNAQIDLHDPATLTKLTTAIISFENGKQPYATATIAAGVGAALGTQQLALVADSATAPAPPLPSDDVLGEPVKTGVAWVDALSEGDRLHFLQAASTERQRGLSTLQATLKAREADISAMVLSGVAPPLGSEPKERDYIEAYGQVDGPQRYRENVRDVVQVGVGIRAMATATPAERARIIGAQTPQPGPGFDHQLRLQSALVKAADLVERRLGQDSARYAFETMPKVREAWSAMQAVLSDPKAAPQDRVSAVTGYANLTIAEQERLGVSTLRADVLGEGGKARQPGPRLLTNDQANGVAAKFRDKPADAAQLVGALQSQWGSYFPTVFQQLTQDAKLPPAAMVIANMSDAFAKETLARYSDPKTQKELMDLTPAATKEAISMKLQQLNEPFWQSLAFQNGGIDVHSIVLEQQKVLAAVYVKSGTDVAAAAQLAFRQTVGHKYEFDDTLRIPKDQQPDIVRGGLRVLMNDAERLDISVPQSFRSGLTDKDRKDAWVDALRTGATWVVNSDESGVALLVAARKDDGMVAYFTPRTSEGRPTSWSWGQLRNLYADRPGAATSDTFLQAALAKGDRATVDRILRDRARARYLEAHGLAPEARR